MDTRIAVVAASTRSTSINAALARAIAERLASYRPDTDPDSDPDTGIDVDLIDLTDHEMPLYHGDLEAEHGQPRAAIALTERLRRATALVVVTPEYNGAFPALLKNSIDWVTRVDRAAIRHLLVFLASATPGGGGGRRVLTITRAWFESMRVDVAEPELGVPMASLDGDAADGLDALDGLDDGALDEFVGHVVAASTSRETGGDDR